MCVYTYKQKHMVQNQDCISEKEAISTAMVSSYLALNHDGRFLCILPEKLHTHTYIHIER